MIRIVFSQSQPPTYSAEPSCINEEAPPEVDSDDTLPDTRAAKNLMKGFCLSIAYSASTGGAGTLVGTAPNLVLKGYFETNYPTSNLTFLTYMGYSLPVAVFMILLAWIALVVLWLPKK